MEKLTIVRLGQVKDVQTKFGPKKKTGAQFKEYPDVWHDIWSGDLKEGQVVEGTREPREYQGKTYWGFSFPRKDDKAMREIETLRTAVTMMNLRMVELEKKVFPPTIAGTDRPYPTPESNQTRMNPAIARIEAKVFPATIQGTDKPYPTAESEGLTDEPPF